MVVGAPYKYNDDSPNERSVYDFMLNFVGTWTEDKKVNVSDGASYDYFV